MAWKTKVRSFAQRLQRLVLSMLQMLTVDEQLQHYRARYPHVGG